MRVSTLRAVDRWVGAGVCLLLTMHRRVFRRREAARAVRRILFVKLAEQGSTVLAAEALRRAVAQVGRDNVFFLVFEENRFILDALNIVPVGNVVTIDVRSVAAAMHSAIVAVRRLRAFRVDAAIDLEFFARFSAVLAYLSGASVRVGLHSHAGEGPYRGDLLTHRLVYNAYLHTSQLFVVLLEAIAAPPTRFPAFAAEPPALPPLRPGYDVPAADLAAMQALLRDRTGLPEPPPIILLNANCSDAVPLRRWEPSRYVELAKRLLAARPELHVVFTGAPAEADEADRLAADVASPRCVSVAGRTTLTQLLALYSLCQVLVTNDSGPAHFATLTPIDVVTLFGPETPALFAARTERNHVLWAQTVCSPCVSAYNNRLSACHDNICMQCITVDEVFDATLEAYLAR